MQNDECLKEQNTIVMEDMEKSLEEFFFSSSNLILYSRLFYL